MSDSFDESDIDAADQALKRLEDQLEAASRRIADAERAPAQGDSRGRLVRAMAQARILARQEGVAKTIGRGGRKIARKLGLAKASPPEAPSPKQDIEETPQPPDTASLRAFFTGIEKIRAKADEFDRIVASRNTEGPNYVAGPEVAPFEQAVKLLAIYEPALLADDGAAAGLKGWSVVASGTPRFRYHYQPHIPDALGFYDTRVSAVQVEQARMAAQFGIHGFVLKCATNFDWQLASAFASNKDISLPFCAMFGDAQWDGASIERLKDLLPHPNYLKSDGLPVILVEDPTTLGDVCETVQRWREWGARNNIGKLYLICGQRDRVVDPRSNGFDAAINYPAQFIYEDPAFVLREMDDEFQGKVFSYPALVGRKSHQPTSPAYATYSCVFPCRDDEPMSPGKGTTFAFSTPELYKRWLRNACSVAVDDQNNRDKFVFVDSWNSWPRGAHLEPDRRYGFGYLKATAEGLEFASKFAGRGEKGQEIVSDLIKTPDFEKFLALCEDFFGYKVPDKWREMATRGEAAFRAKLASIDDHIILVHSVGKVGSTSVYHALLRGPLAPITFHTHLIPNGLKVASEVVKQYAFPLDALYFIRLGEWVTEFLEKRGKDVRISVVSGVRDPIARNVASFFDNLSELVPNVRARWEAKDVGAEELHQIYLHIANESPGEWFQRQLEPITGTDVYSRPFNVSEGYDVYENGNVRTIVIRVEDLDRCGHASLTKFFGLDDIPLARENKADDKFYASLLREFRSKPMPKEYLDTMYGGQFAKHFYSPQEIEAFRAKWSGKR